MTIRDLSIFIAVAEQLSMSKAAEKLHLAQPTVSAVIGSLEKDYGVLLFDRLGRGLHLTDEGRFLLSRSRSIVGLVDTLESELGAYTRQQTIRIGATITVGSTLLADLIARFESNHPLLRAQIQVDNTQTIERLLLDGSLDLALIEGVVQSKSLICNPCYVDELIPVCARKFPAPSTLSLKTLSDYPLILREEGSGTRALFVGLLQEQGISFEEKWSCHSSDAIVSAVCAGQGITVISRRLVRHLIKEGTLRELSLLGVDMKRNFSLVHHKDKVFTPSMEKLLHLLKCDTMQE
nr:LysR family transcriptional regulator [uncultured Sphaerochaeta sp.]